MSASEKLRALEAESKEDHGGDSGPYDVAQDGVAYALLRALPLIADVVEAAERVDEQMAAGMKDAAVFGRIAGEAHVALTALREALEGGDVT